MGEVGGIELVLDNILLTFLGFSEHILYFNAISFLKYAQDPRRGNYSTSKGGIGVCET